MRLFSISFLFLIVSFSGFAENKLSEKENSVILRLLDIQVAAWNSGNLEKFMETYWNSDELVFVGSSGPTYG